MSKKITNTTEQHKENAPGLIPAGLMGAPGHSGLIENMEAEGQRELAGQVDQLPTEGLTKNRWGDKGSDTPWEAMGIKIGEPVEGDEIWTSVTLPAGWSIKPTEHSMWSDLVDDKGRKRGAIFYKAAFYDRSAHIHSCRRFNYRADYDNKDESKRIVLIEDACTNGPIRIITEPVADPEKKWESNDRADTKAKAWLEENYPDYLSPVAYWD